MARSKQEAESIAVKKLSDVVQISRQFLRSVRIDTDFGRDDALSGYVCQGTARGLLESMALQIRETRQRAFTWTGPYGGGKSSLALMLCSLVGHNSVLRTQAKAILNLPKDSPVHAAFDSKADGWMVLPIVGKRGKVTEEISRQLNINHVAGGRRKSKSDEDVIGSLVSIAEAHPQGVLLIIDELGKFLESAAQDGDDIYFFQELAEAASRCSGKLVVVGILHQSFEAYATRLGRQARDDWAKVQGRFIDIPLVAGSDEVIELVGRAITVGTQVEHHQADAFSKTIAHAIKNRRPGTPSDIGASLAACWPLHPVVAALLGPISRRRFSQNERSTFGFLASREPLGFMEFLEGSPVSWSSMYGPARYWDYLAANLETAILASPDGHRWAVASEAVERAVAKGTHVHVELTKCVALIEMFRSGSGLLPELEVLEVCVQGADKQAVGSALKDLVSWKILIERKHLESYGVFAGSDFDIEAAVIHARQEMELPQLAQLSALTDLQPVLAKRLYHETGALRWFSRRIVRLDDVVNEFTTHKPVRGSVGTFVLCLPSIGEGVSKARHRIRLISEENRDVPLIIGVPENAERISELGMELAASELVFKTRTELEGDSVARKEILGRLATIRAALEEELADAYLLSQWYWRGRLVEGSHGKPISWIASTVAGEIYPKSPIVHNELVNRQEPSSNSKTARKALMYRMVSHSGTENLGYEGFSADAGLYYSILHSSRLHGSIGDGLFGFKEPSVLRDERLYLMWTATAEFVLTEGLPKRLSDVYDFWMAPPYGVREGLLPIFGLAFFLAHRSTLALYIEGAFTSDLTEAVIDEWLHDPKRIELRYVSASSDQSAFVDAVIGALPNDSKPDSTRPLDVARALVAVAVGLPNWAKRTSNLTPEAQSIRATLLKANDPHKLLFSDLPTLLEAASSKDIERKLSAILTELTTSYSKILRHAEKTVLAALDQEDRDYSNLQARAKVVKGLAGEFRLEAFIVRLETFDGTEAAIESLISLGNSKSPSQWIDRDLDAALLQLSSWAYEFRKAETVAPIRGRPSSRRALSVVFGAGQGKEVTASADIDEKDTVHVSQLASVLLADLQQQPKSIALAALAEAGALLFSNKMKEGA